MAVLIRGFVFSVALLSLTCVSVLGGGPWCFRCTDAFHPAICQNVIQCGDHELCHTEVKISNNGAKQYSTSCKADMDCTTRVKRAVNHLTLCSECCSSTLCNVKGCQAPKIRDPGRLFCLNCDAVQNPADCDSVDLCSQDQICSVSVQERFGLKFYKLGCLAKTSCPAVTATLTKDKSICCDTDLCNSNDVGVSPAQYTTTPIPTTRLPSPANASFDDDTFTYNVTHAANETMDLVCHVTGGPVPGVTWTYDDGQNVITLTQGISTGPTGYESILSIPTPDKSKEGIYKCKADNANGKSEATINVTVQVPPHIDGALNQSVAVPVQEDITLPCKVAKDNSTTSKWIISPQIKSYKINADNSLTLFNVHDENTGEYLCVAENADGKTEKMYHIEVTGTNVSQSSCSCTTAQSPVSPSLMPSSTSASSSVLTTTSTTLSSSVTTKKTTPTTKTTTTPTTTTPTTTTSTTSLPSTPLTQPPSSSPVSNQFQDVKGNPVNVLQCPATTGTPSSPVTWHRLIQDFNHTDPAFYDNKNGVLTIISHMSILMTGVYECRQNNLPVAQFVVYDRLIQNVLCNNVFGDSSPTKGVVIRATCGPCANPLGIRPNLQLKTSDFICESAIAMTLIPAYGGNVTYLIKDNNEVQVIDVTSGNMIVL